MDAVEYKVLPPPLGEGAEGVVWKVVPVWADDGSKGRDDLVSWVVKVPKSPLFDMKGEINLFRLLRLQGIQDLPARASDNKKFLFKGLVPGLTLGRIMSERKISEEASSNMRRGLAKLVGQIIRTKARVLDLNYGNLIYNDKNESWTVIDGSWNGEYYGDEELAFKNLFRYFTPVFHGMTAYQKIEFFDVVDTRLRGLITHERLTELVYEMTGFNYQVQLGRLSDRDLEASKKPKKAGKGRLTSFLRSFMKLFSVPDSPAVRECPNRAFE